MNDIFEELITNNKLGIKNYDKFEKTSRKYTANRIFEIQKNPIKGNFDYQHLKDIHKFIFQDVFEWAGKDRAELRLFDTFAKRSPFNPNYIQNFVPGKELKKYLKNSKDLNSFAKGMANFLMELNALHPFREGNGRTQRIFCNELAKNAGYKMDLNLISNEKMLIASVEASQIKPAKLEALIKANLKSFKQNLAKEQGIFF